MNKIIMVVLGIGVLTGLVFGGLWVFDAPVGATIVEKRCGAIGTGEVDVKPDIMGGSFTLEVPQSQCNTIQKGNYVQYNVRTERTSIWDHKGGTCIYDTEHGPAGCNTDR